MATIGIYLDKRGTTGAAPLKISISKHSSTAYISTGIKVLPSQWDRKAEKVKDHPDKHHLNTYISNRRSEVQKIIMQFSIEGKLRNMTATQIKNIVQEQLEPTGESVTLYSYFKSFALSRNAERTQQIYLETLRRITEYDSMATTMRLEDVTKKWLDGLEIHYKSLGQSDSTISIDLRNIRAVINDAIDNELLSTYVFRKKKIKTARTRKRSLSVERLRELFNYEVEPWQQRYLDMFKLTFYLIGINLVDLSKLEKIEDGRICYTRQKTHRPYYIKVEPEALEIINKYRGEKFLLNIRETFKSYKSFMNKTNRGLQSIGASYKVDNPKYTEGSRKHRQHTRRESEFAGITMYWARHTWATIAAELEIPKETISAALGHSSSGVTDVYIKFNYSKVDEANRKVIDYVLNK